MYVILLTCTVGNGDVQAMCVLQQQKAGFFLKTTKIEGFKEMDNPTKMSLGGTTCVPITPKYLCSPIFPSCGIDRPSQHH
jgi:hypothetical protein